MNELYVVIKEVLSRIMQRVMGTLSYGLRIRSEGAHTL